MGNSATRKREPPASNMGARMSSVLQKADQMRLAKNAPVAATGTSGDALRPFAPGAVPKNNVCDAKPSQPVQLPPLVLPPPPSSCLVQSKYLPRAGAAGRPQSPSPGAPNGSDKSPAPDGALPAGTPSDSGSKTWRPGADDSAALRAKNDKNNPFLLTCGPNAESLPPIGPKNVLAEISRPALAISTQGMDERSTRLFIDYLAQHAMGFRGPRDILWFKTDMDRSLLKQRDRSSAIAWTPFEEIALSANDNVTAPESNGTQVALGGEKRHNVSPKVEEAETKEGKDANQHRRGARSRTRPIISNDVPYRMQLATKAIEDNVIFIQARLPKGYK